MPKISIVVPVYKVEAYLHRCVDSILGQTFSDFELILVDDGSPDRCPEICDQYADNDARIHVIHQLNAGVSAARNAALNTVAGEFIMFCDSDDYVDPDWCESMLLAAQKYPDCGIVCNAQREAPDGTLLSRFSDAASNSCKSVSYFSTYASGLSGSVCTHIFKRSTLLRLGLRFEEGRQIGEDSYFCSQYLTSCRRHFLIGTPMYHYMTNPNGAMHRYYWNELELHLPLFAARIPLLAKDDIPAFCDSNLYSFMQMLPTVFDKRNSMPFIKKMAYNQKMFTSPEFQYCLKYSSGSHENPLVLKILKTHNYYLYWLFEQLIKLKRKLWR